MYFHVKVLFLVLILSVVWELSKCSQVRGGNRNLNDPNNQRNMMIEQFKYALINESDQLFTLQKVFLLPRPVDGGLCLEAMVTVKARVTDNSEYDPSSVCSVIDNKNGTVCTYLSKEGFELSSATSTETLVDFLRSPAIVQVLSTLDPSFYFLTSSLLYHGSTVPYHYDANYPTYKRYQLSVTIDKIEFNSLSRVQDDVTDAVQIALSWAKAYSMNGDNPVQGKLDDISWVKDECSLYDSTTTAPAMSLHYNLFSNSQATAILIFLTYLLLNILILTFAVLHLGEVFKWIEKLQPQRKNLKYLYKASAIVSGFINLVTFGSDVLLHIFFGGYLIYRIIIKYLLVIFIFISVIVASCFYTRKYGSKWKIMHALALCQFVWFVHRLATDAIISTIVFAIAPAQTLGLITLLLSIIVCAVIFVSSLLQQCSACTSRCTSHERKTVTTIFCSFLIALCSVALIFTVTLLFIAFVDNGLQSTGVGGFVLSLLPPIIVSVLGLIINRKVVLNFFHKVLTSSSIMTSTTNSSSDVDESVIPADGNINSQADETDSLEDHL